MRATLLVMASAALIAGLAGADEPEQRPAVAVVNMRRVFEEYKAHQQRNRELHAWANERREELKRQLATARDLTYASLVQELGRHQPDSPEYRLIEQQCLQMTDLNCAIPLETVDNATVQREASMYRTSLGEIQAAIRQHAQENGILLVLRYREQRDFCGISNPDNRIPFYHDMPIDITDAVVARLNAAANRPAKK